LTEIGSGEWGGLYSFSLHDGLEREGGRQETSRRAESVEKGQNMKPGKENGTVGKLYGKPKEGELLVSSMLESEGE